MTRLFLSVPKIGCFLNSIHYPQIYLKGEFVGGCDILLNMHQSGELVEELGKIGIKSALVAEGEEENNKDNEKK